MSVGWIKESPGELLVKDTEPRVAVNSKDCSYSQSYRERPQRSGGYRGVRFGVGNEGVRVGVLCEGEFRDGGILACMSMVCALCHLRTGLAGFGGKWACEAWGGCLYVPLPLL